MARPSASKKNLKFCRNGESLSEEILREVLRVYRGDRDSEWEPITEMLRAEKNRVTLYTLPELAQKLHVSVRTLREYIRKNQLFANKIGRSYLVTEDNLLKFLFERETTRLICRR